MPLGSPINIGLQTTKPSDSDHDEHVFENTYGKGLDVLTTVQGFVHWFWTYFTTRQGAWTSLLKSLDIGCCFNTRRSKHVVYEVVLLSRTTNIM